MCRNTRALSPIQRIPDTYGALRLLATHPRLDTRRLALMGFSHGGSVTVGAATRWAHERYAPTAGAAFRAFFPFYPGCGTVYPERMSISAPLRIHIGELDDWTPAAPCREPVQALRGSGQDADRFAHDQPADQTSTRPDRRRLARRRAPPWLVADWCPPVALVVAIARRDLGEKLLQRIRRTIRTDHDHASLHRHVNCVALADLRLECHGLGEPAAGKAVLFNRL